MSLQTDRRLVVLVGHGRLGDLWLTVETWEEYKDPDEKLRVVSGYTVDIYQRPGVDLTEAECRQLDDDPDVALAVGEALSEMRPEANEP